MPSLSPIRRRDFLAASAVALGGAAGVTAEPAGRRLRAGAFAKDITPREFPVLSNGMFGPRTAERAYTPLFARCLVLDDGTTPVVICAVDTCLMPRDMLDDVKERVEKATGIPASRILISATHCHTAPSVLSALGCPVDAKYEPFLRQCLVEAGREAAARLAPARIGWAVANAGLFHDCRQGILPPDQMWTDPFGQKTVRAYMQTQGIGPAGPTDPDLSIVAVQSPEGRPVALLANFAFHYFGGGPLVSSDAAGLFCRKIAAMLGGDPARPAVGIFSQGTSGDAFWHAFHKPQPKFTLDRYAEGLARLAHSAYKTIQFHDWCPIAMAEALLPLGRRAPDPARLAWARQVLEGKIRPPSGLSKIYAQEAIYLHEKPTAELKLQAVRIGELAITAMPNEVYAITGLKLKAQSPVPTTFNITCANGSEGYVPPPEHHKLGGYTTWPARSAGLEVAAEPKIVAAVLGLLEKVAQKPRRQPDAAVSRYARAVLAAKPAAYWRLREFSGPAAADASGHGTAGTFEDGVVFFLEGPDLPGCRGGQHLARAARFAGGRMKAEVKGLGDTYTVEFWFWNALPADTREVTGWLFSRPAGEGRNLPGDHLGIGGTLAGQGGLVLACGGDPDEWLAGTTAIPLRTWNHVVLVRQGAGVSVYLNGHATPEIAGRLPVGFTPDNSRVFLGGRSDNSANLEGKLAEAAVYAGALTAREIAEHWAAAQHQAVQ